MTKKVGRPTKKNAIKAGTVKKGLVRFTFITESVLVDKIKFTAKCNNLSVKQFMTDLLIEKLGNKKTLSNEEKMLQFLRKNN
jgi:hypothetical protein